MQLAAASTFQHTDKEQQANAAHHLMDDIAMQYACSCMEQQDLEPYNDKYNLFGGRSTDSAWLSLEHVSSRLEVLLHMKAREAEEQPA